jgi:hypothetical protein
LSVIVGFPKCLRECDVYFFEPAVGDTVDGADEAGWEVRGEGGFVALEPTKGAGDDDFIKGVAAAGFGGECDFVTGAGVFG